MKTLLCVASRARAVCVVGMEWRLLRVMNQGVLLRTCDSHDLLVNLSWSVPLSIWKSGMVVTMGGYTSGMGSSYLFWRLFRCSRHGRGAAVARIDQA